MSQKVKVHTHTQVILSFKSFWFLYGLFGTRWPWTCHFLNTSMQHHTWQRFMFLCVYVCTWRSKFDTRYFPQSLSTLFVRQSLSQAQGSSCLHLQGVWITRHVPSYLAFFIGEYRRSELKFSHLCSSTWMAEPSSPQQARVLYVVLLALNSLCSLP